MSFGSGKILWLKQNLRWLGHGDGWIYAVKAATLAVVVVLNCWVCFLLWVEWLWWICGYGLLVWGKNWRGYGLPVWFCMLAWGKNRRGYRLLVWFCRLAWGKNWRGYGLPITRLTDLQSHRPPPQPQAKWKSV
ncbi:hypothetical protein FCV25MIE_29769 [Fagus crenata]